MSINLLLHSQRLALTMFYIHLVINVHVHIHVYPHIINHECWDWPRYQQQTSLSTLYYTLYTIHVYLHTINHQCWDWPRYQQQTSLSILHTLYTMYIHTLLIISAGTGLDTSNRPAS